MPLPFGDRIDLGSVGALALFAHFIVVEAVQIQGSASVSDDPPHLAVSKQIWSRQLDEQLDQLVVGQLQVWRRRTVVFRGRDDRFDRAASAVSREARECLAGIGGGQDLFQPARNAALIALAYLARAALFLTLSARGIPAGKLMTRHR